MSILEMGKDSPESSILRPTAASELKMANSPHLQSFACGTVAFQSWDTWTFVRLSVRHSLPSHRQDSSIWNRMQQNNLTPDFQEHQVGTVSLNSVQFWTLNT